MKKALSLILALSMMAAMLAGCGGGGSGEPAGDTPSGGDSDKPYAGETLTVLYMSSVYADAARAMAPEFEEATGATVEVVMDPLTGPDE